MTVDYIEHKQFKVYYSDQSSEIAERLMKTSNKKEEQMLKPLTVHPTNPRYFTDGSGKAVYLTGSHTWNNFQHNQVYPSVDYNKYLDFLQEYNHNFIRMWAWEQAAWDPWAVGKVSVEPIPYQRTGPGNALDGKPKFDLTQFNQAYLPFTNQSRRCSKTRHLCFGDAI